MKTLRSVILLIALSLVFVFGLSLGVYTSHANPAFYRQFALFRTVIPAQPLEIAESSLEGEEVPQLSDAVGMTEETVIDVLESAPLASSVEQPTSAVHGDRMSLTNLEGNTIAVVLLDADEQTVKIRREQDSREFEIGLDTLIEVDRAAIAAWREAKPAGAADSGEVDLEELFKMFDD